MRICYERERSLHERANMISSAEARGREEGLEKGLELGREEGARQEKIQVAIKLLNMNIPMEQIVLVTGLIIEEIKLLN